MSPVQMFTKSQLPRGVGFEKFSLIDKIKSL